MFEQTAVQTTPSTELAQVDLRPSKQRIATLYIYPSAKFVGQVFVQATLRENPIESSWTTLDELDCTDKLCVTYNASTRYVKLRLIAKNITSGKIVRVAICL